MGYPIIENSNYQNDTSDRAKAVHAARLAVDRCTPWALTDELENALQDLELALATELTASVEFVRATSRATIEAAEVAVEDAYLAAQAAHNQTRES